MNNFCLPLSITIKEIIRYDENLFVLNADVRSCVGWEIRVMPMYIRTDVKALSEILRLENRTQTSLIEEPLLGMVSVGKPPRIDVKELTGRYLTLELTEVILRLHSAIEPAHDLHGLPQLLDLFPRIQTEPLGNYFNLENEFSKEVLEKTFTDFQRMLFLQERGYIASDAAAMVQVDNPIAAMVYSKIRSQFATTEEKTPLAEAQEDILEENYSELAALPF